MKKLLFGVLPLCLSLLLVLCACAPTATDISLDITSHKMGEDWTQPLTATLSPAGAKDTIIWTSSNPEVATVNEKGVVSGVAGGTATITARTASGLTATCEIEVWHSHERTEVWPATCFAPGAEVYTCKFCNHSYENYLPALGYEEHRWNSSGTCTRCGISPYDYSQVRVVSRTGYPAYDVKLAEFIQALALGTDGVDCFDWERYSYGAASVFEETCKKYHNGDTFYAFFTTLIPEPDSDSHTLCYALYDINADGTPELLISVVPNEDWMYRDLEVYGLNSTGEVVCVGCGLYRTDLTILSDGRLLEEGSSGAAAGDYKLYRLGTDCTEIFIEGYFFDDYSPTHWDDRYKYLGFDAFLDRIGNLLADSVMDQIEWIPFPR